MKAGFVFTINRIDDKLPHLIIFFIYSYPNIRL